MKKKILTLGLVFLATFILVACGNNQSKNTENTENTEDIDRIEKELEEERKQEEEEAEEEQEREEEAERQDPNSYESVDYITLARNPENYVGKKLKFSGEILQVIEGDSNTEYRLAVNNDYDNVVYMSISNDDLPQRILEEDLVTVYGESTGKITYESTLGGNITIPSMVIYMFNIDGHKE